MWQSGKNGEEERATQNLETGPWHLGRGGGGAGMKWMDTSLGHGMDQVGS